MYVKFDILKSGPLKILLLHAGFPQIQIIHKNLLKHHKFDPVLIVPEIHKRDLVLALKVNF